METDAAADAAPSASASEPIPAPTPTREPPPPAPPKLHCPEGMMAVKNAYCIDRWEASLVDKSTNRILSPYYPPDRKLATFLLSTWDKERLTMGGPEAHDVPLPPLPAFEQSHDVEPKAVSRPNVVPSGYMSGVMAELACANAGKRLCTYDEWRTACRGESNRQFPYGDSYVQGACNIFRSAHPAVVLHDNASIGHTDPRLNLVKDGDEPLLRKTGATPRCKSEWDGDAAWDMNGNLDEWVADEKGHFVGGFYSRSKRDGCDSSVSAHPKTYFDYSTGTRCCWSP